MTRLLQHLRRRAGDERGAALILVVVSLPALVGFGIFVIDVGNWWVHKRHLQTQADAAALAGAREFRLPACNDREIVEEAVDYSGGVLSDPDVNYTAFNGAPLNYNHQLAASARPSGPTQGLHTQVNTPDPYNRAPEPLPEGSIDDDLAAMPAAERLPCSSLMVDVKMTETDIAGRFSPLRFLDVLGFVDFIDARARVELRGLLEATDMLPLAVEDVNPKKVHVWLYDEDTQELLGQADVLPQPDEDGLMIYDNSTSNDGTPITVSFKPETLNGQNVTKRRIGAVVGLSGTDSVDCTVVSVQCFGTPGNGVTRIRGTGPYETPGSPLSCSNGTDDDGDGAIDNKDDDCLGDVIILKDSSACALHDNGYFSADCEQATMKVFLPGFDGTNAAPGQKAQKVFARIQQANGTTDVELHWVAAAGTVPGHWATTGSDRIPIDPGVGTRRIDILWEQTKRTMPGIGRTARTSRAIPASSRSRTCTRCSAARVRSPARSARCGSTSTGSRV